jgi:hypothetical protein
MEVMLILNDNFLEYFKVNSILVILLHPNFIDSCANTRQIKAQFSPWHQSTALITILLSTRGQEVQAIIEMVLWRI